MLDSFYNAWLPKRQQFLTDIYLWNMTARWPAGFPELLWINEGLKPVTLNQGKPLVCNLSIDQHMFRASAI